MFHRTSMTLDEFYSKEKGVQMFLLASMSYKLEKEYEEYKEMERQRRRRSTKRK